MADTIKELRQKNAKLMEDMKGILDAAEKEGRALEGEALQEYERMETEFDGNKGKIEAEERRERLAVRELELKYNSGDGDPNGGPEERELNVEAEKRMAMFGSFLRSGIKGLQEAEVRALQSDADIYGGYIVPPQQWVGGLIKAIDNETFMIGLSTVFQNVTADSLGQAALDNDPADPTWTAEIATGSADSTMSFGKRELRPHPLAQRILVSRKLLRVSTEPAENLVRERLGYKAGVVAENAFQNGSGSNQPLGVFTASASGINTDRDVSTGNTRTSIGADGLIEAKYTLKGGYHKIATWLFHRDAVKQIRKLKDGNGDYLWQKGLTSDRPDTILDIPYKMSEYAPNTFTTGLYVGILGAFKYYYIAISLAMEIQRLEELYAATNQVGFIGRMEVDGMPALAEAFVRVKLA